MGHYGQENCVHLGLSGLGLILLTAAGMGSCFRFGTRLMLSSVCAGQEQSWLSFSPWGIAGDGQEAGGVPAGQ